MVVAVARLRDEEGGRKAPAAAKSVMPEMMLDGANVAVRSQPVHQWWPCQCHTSIVYMQ